MGITIRNKFFLEWIQADKLVITVKAQKLLALRQNDSLIHHLSLMLPRPKKFGDWNWTWIFLVGLVAKLNSERNYFLPD